MRRLSSAGRRAEALANVIRPCQYGKNQHALVGLDAIRGTIVIMPSEFVAMARGIAEVVKRP